MADFLKWFTRKVADHEKRGDAAEFENAIDRWILGFKDELQQVDQDIRKEWESLGLPCLEEMLRSPEAAEFHLKDPNPACRRLALEVLQRQWKYTQASADYCELLCVQDPDPIVRRMAVFALGHFYEKSNNARISRMLAAIACDETAEPGLREGAYFGLHDVCGNTAFDHPLILTASKGGFRFPEDVDWDFVRKFVQ